MGIAVIRSATGLERAIHVGMPQAPQALHVPEKMTQAPSASVLRLMLNGHANNWQQTIPLQLETQADIHIFTVHEVTTIKTTKFRENSDGEYHECPIDPLPRLGSVTGARNEIAAQKRYWS